MDEQSSSKEELSTEKEVGRDGDGSGYVGPRGLPLTVADLGGSKCAGSKCAREPPFGFFNHKVFTIHHVSLCQLLLK